ncbi:MAG: hypothetical protein JO208_14430 [Alphaproteobacteria bacterium]|nr:hypothetical protein [Alphaproteobacteria bacterium]
MPEQVKTMPEGCLQRLAACSANLNQNSPGANLSDAGLFKLAELLYEPSERMLAGSNNRYGCKNP